MEFAIDAEGNFVTVNSPMANSDKLRCAECKEPVFLIRRLPTYHFRHRKIKDSSCTLYTKSKETLYSVLSLTKKEKEIHGSGLFEKQKTNYSTFKLSFNAACQLVYEKYKKDEELPKFRHPIQYKLDVSGEKKYGQGIVFGFLENLNGQTINFDYPESISSLEYSNDTYSHFWKLIDNDMKSKMIDKLGLVVRNGRYVPEKDVFMCLHIDSINVIEWGYFMTNEVHSNYLDLE